MAPSHVCNTKFKKIHTSRCFCLSYGRSQMHFRQADLQTCLSSSGFLLALLSQSLTIVTFLYPLRVAIPSKMILFLYPVPAQKILSYPSYTLCIRYACHSSRVNDNFRILLSSSSNSWTDFFDFLMPYFQLKEGVLCLWGVPLVWFWLIWGCEDVCGGFELMVLSRQVHNQLTSDCYILACGVLSVPYSSVEYIGICLTNIF